MQFSAISQLNPSNVPRTELDLFTWDSRKSNLLFDFLKPFNGQCNSLITFKMSL